MRTLKEILKFIGMAGYTLFIAFIGWQCGRGYEITKLHPPLISETEIKPGGTSFDELVENIWQVESSRRIMAPVGDDGQSFGPLQISRDALIDVNRWYGKRYVVEDLQDLTTAKQIARLYISMWFDANREEIAARIFNGGPRGWEKQATKEYWRKVSGQRIACSGQHSYFAPRRFVKRDAGTAQGFAKGAGAAIALARSAKCRMGAEGADGINALVPKDKLNRLKRELRKLAPGCLGKE